MISEKDKRHADLLAAFFSQLGMAFVAGGMLQLALSGADSRPGAAAIIFMLGFALHGVAHVVVERSS